MNNGYVVDCEGDSFTPTRLWCVSAHNLTTNKQKSTTNYDSMRKLLLTADYLVMHNGARFDVPCFERILGIKIKAKLVDSLALSWYLFPERNRHGLEEWGEEFGIPKPKIIEWDNPDMIGEYIHRCEEDVKINTKLWKKCWRLLNAIYETEDDVWRLIDYLTFKMDCAREQERCGWKLDVAKCHEALDELRPKLEDTMAKLIEAMPTVSVITKKTKPAKPFKKDGSWSSHGANWFKLLRDNNLPGDYDDVVEVVTGEKLGNPNASQQLKNWLYSYDWKPETFKYDRDKEAGEIRKIPQINLEHGAGICPSVRRLYNVNPHFELLEGLGVLRHRISILNGFLDSMDDNGFVKARINGLTNTLRFQHKEIVNLPKATKAYGEIIRGVLIAPEDMELCGSDMSSLEDRLKQHYLWPYDPDYVKQMMVDDFDPHLDLALLAKEVTEGQVEEYKWYSKLKPEEKEMADKVRMDLAKSIKPIRDIFKNGNYACQYGAGAPRLALTANISIKKAEQVWNTYWKKNWAIKEVAKNQYIIKVGGQMWLKNPINSFFYSLRYEKDIFSTLVQGSASYVFDLWVQEFRKKRPQLTGQFHDEVVICVKKGFREQATKLLRDAINKVNDQLKLNRELDIDVQFGNKYSEIH